jgi:Flp pilus assembly protein TadB
MFDFLGRAADMPERTERLSFRETYRQQYRQISASRTSRAFRIITPAVFLAVAVLTRLTHHSPVIAIVLAALAAVLLAVTIGLTRRQRRNPAAPSADPQKSGQQPAPAITGKNEG